MTLEEGSRRAERRREALAVCGGEFKREDLIDMLEDMITYYGDIDAVIDYCGEGCKKKDLQDFSHEKWAAEELLKFCRNNQSGYADEILWYFESKMWEYYALAGPESQYQEAYRSAIALVQGIYEDFWNMYDEMRSEAEDVNSSKTLRTICEG